MKDTSESIMSDVSDRLCPVLVRHENAPNDKRAMQDVYIVETVRKMAFCGSVQPYATYINVCSS